MQLLWLPADCHSYIKMLICLQTTLSVAVKLCAERTFCDENICLQKWKLRPFKCLSCSSKGQLLIWKQSKHFRFASLLATAYWVVGRQVSIFYANYRWLQQFASKQSHKEVFSILFATNFTNKQPATTHHLVGECIFFPSDQKLPGDFSPVFKQAKISLSKRPKLILFPIKGIHLAQQLPQTSSLKREPNVKVCWLPLHIFWLQNEIWVFRTLYWNELLSPLIDKIKLLSQLSLFPNQSPICYNVCFPNTTHLKHSA